MHSLIYLLFISKSNIYSEKLGAATSVNDFKHSHIDLKKKNIQVSQKKGRKPYDF